MQLLCGINVPSVRIRSFNLSVLFYCSSQGPDSRAPVDPTLCTRVVNKDGISVAVVEHLLAAFRICEITNAVVEVDTDEIPIMDGSALEFVRSFKDVAGSDFVKVSSK